MYKHLDRFHVLFACVLLFVGFVYTLPHFLRYKELKNYGQFYFPWTAEANFDMFNVHAGRYREIIDGHFFSGEVDTIEHKDGPAIWPLLSADIFTPFLLLTKSVFSTIIITDFLFSIFIFFSFYILFNFITHNRLFSLFSSVILLLFPQLPLLLPPSSIGELKQFFYLLTPVSLSGHLITENLTYLRREAFIPSAPFFILFFSFVYQYLLLEKKNKFLLLVAGIFYGLLFYFYFYYWVFATIFLGILFLGFLWKKLYQEATSIFYLVIIGIFVSIPFWVSHFRLSSLPQYQEIIERAGIEVGHSFRLDLWKTYVLYIFLAGIVIWLGKKIQRNFVSSFFLAAVCLASVVVLNIQVVTGYNVQSDHWSCRVFLIVIGIVWVSIIYYFRTFFLRYINLNFKKPYKVIIFCCAVIILIIPVSNLIISIISVEKAEAYKYTTPNNLRLAYNWLDKNTQVDSVVMTPSLETNIDLPVFTHNNIFLARAQNTTASEKELVERLFITFKMFGLPSTYLNEKLTYQSVIMYFFSVRYGSRSLDAYLRPEKYGSLKLSAPFMLEVIKNYEKFVLPKSLQYQLDYIFIGPREKELNFNEDFLKKYTQIYNLDGVEIYKIER